ncbi:MAG TPA: YciI family protein, partial [Gemmatimonadota bacterium]|nr:YciI family protein [Gemmatimonadota bacterium]
PDLEGAVVAELAARGLVTPSRSTAARGLPEESRAGGAGPRLPGTWWEPRWNPWFLGAAASLLLFLAGWAIGRATAPTLPEGERFMLLFYETRQFDLPEEPEAYTALVERYAGWADSLREEGIGVLGDELMPEGAVLALDARAAAGRPGLDEAEYLGGYMILGAPDMETAVEISRTHPHLEYGGTVVVRPIVEME